MYFTFFFFKQYVPHVYRDCCSNRDHLRTVSLHIGHRDIPHALFVAA